MNFTLMMQSLKDNRFDESTDSKVIKNRSMLPRSRLPKSSFV